jgi:hypothetical protein
MMMITRSTFAVVAGLAMLSAGALTQNNEPRAHHDAWAMQATQACAAETLTSDCKPVVAIASKDDDWTASGGAMRGLNQ